jgi:hypothetical protein
MAEETMSLKLPHNRLPKPIPGGNLEMRPIPIRRKMGLTGNRGNRECVSSFQDVRDSAKAKATKAS